MTRNIDGKFNKSTKFLYNKFLWGGAWVLCPFFIGQCGGFKPLNMWAQHNRTHQKYLILCLLRRQDIQHSDTQLNDTQQNVIQHNDTQQRGIQHNDTQHRGIQHNDTQHRGIQHNDTQHNEIYHNDI
jgi:hypothetical protein